MNLAWEHEFRARMRLFEARRAPNGNEVSVSTKLRVISGCFHREHSRNAYDIIDKHLRRGDRPSEPLELIVRRLESDDQFVEETVLRIGHTEGLDSAVIQARLRQALDRIVHDHESLPDSTGCQPATDPNPRTRRRHRRKD